MSSNTWSALTGKGSSICPTERLSLAAEIFVTHDHYDEPANLSYADGILINRHLHTDRQLHFPKPLNKQSDDELTNKTGAHISLAAQEKGSDGLGGELINHFKDTPFAGRPAHEQEWQFLAEHVEQAYNFYKSGLYAWPQNDLNDWQKVEALARYAARWKMRTANVYDSFHPVDVLFHSSYCTGAANILQALAMVAGFQTRFIAISNHSTIEIFVNGRWIWADNIVSGGGVTPNTFNYAEMTADPLAVPSFTDMQRDFYNSRTARYRSPYSLSGQYYWHFMSGEAKGRGDRNDLEAGYGLSVPYDPSTAAALYPEVKQHRFICEKGWGPTICISEKGSLIQARYDVSPGQSIRKSFYIGVCTDNPLKSAVVKLRLANTQHAEHIEATIDGHVLRHAGLNKRFKQDCVDFIIDVELLREGLHEIVFTSKQTFAALVYPDPLLPYLEPITAEHDISISDDMFSIDPCVAPAELAALNEEIITGASMTV